MLFENLENLKIETSFVPVARAFGEKKVARRALVVIFQSVLEKKEMEIMGTMGTFVPTLKNQG